MLAHDQAHLSEPLQEQQRVGVVSKVISVREFGSMDAMARSDNVHANKIVA